LTLDFTAGLAGFFLGFDDRFAFAMRFYSNIKSAVFLIRRLTKANNSIY
jgi:hypothetical protein